MVSAAYPLALAAAGGFLWAFGILGKRVGVEGSPNESKQIRSSITIFIYTLTTVISPTVDFTRIGEGDVSEVFNASAWNTRIPGIIACGVISGLGGLLGTLAFAWSAGSNSALTSMIENGTYTMMGAIIICVFFQEHPKPSAYAACVLIMAGVLLAQRSSGKKPGKEKESTREESDTGSDDHPAPENVVLGPAVCADDTESGSDTEQSVQAPTALRKRAVALAVTAGTCWAFGPLGKKYGVHDCPEDKKHQWTACTYFIYIASTTIVPFFRVICSSHTERKKALGDRQFRCYLLGTMACGLVSGCGGLVSTFAFASEGAISGALISMVENGVYTVFGALLIALIFREHPSCEQILSACLVLAGILVSGIR